MGPGHRQVKLYGYGVFELGIAWRVVCQTEKSRLRIRTVSSALIGAEPRH